MNRVFISYARPNLHMAQRIARDLGDAGLDVWIDLRADDARILKQQDVYRGLERADFMVLCSTPATLHDDWIQRTLTYAREQGKSILRAQLADDAEAITELLGWEWLAQTAAIGFYQHTYERAFPQLLHALAKIRLSRITNRDPRITSNPFKGLEAFQQADATIFFGREELTWQALQPLRQSSVLAVVGASGSGKSSLVRAGILPNIRAGALDGSQNWPIIIFVPGAHPIEAMANRLHPLLADANPAYRDDPHALMHALRQSHSLLDIIHIVLADADTDARLVLVLDQFEDVFTRTNETERAQFLDVVRMTATVTDSRVLLIVTMRAEFFSELSHYPDLAALFDDDHLLVVQDMSEPDLQRVIESPAQMAGLRYQPELVQRIIADVKAEAGSLPLLQYTLRKLFAKREAASLTHAAYDAMGGLSQALATQAEQLYVQLSDEEQIILRRIALCLVEVSENGEITRRSLPLDEVYVTVDADKQVAKQIVGKFSTPDVNLLRSYREIGISEEQAREMLSFSHDVLIHHWPRLKAWTQANFENLQYETMLRKAADQWEANEHDEAFLLPEGRLQLAETWLQHHRATPLQGRFLKASIQRYATKRRLAHQNRLRALRLRERVTQRIRLLIVLLALLIGIWVLYLANRGLFSL